MVTVAIPCGKRTVGIERLGLRDSGMADSPRAQKDGTRATCPAQTPPADFLSSSAFVLRRHGAMRDPHGSQIGDSRLVANAGQCSLYAGVYIIPFFVK